MRQNTQMNIHSTSFGVSLSECFIPLKWFKDHPPLLEEKGDEAEAGVGGVDPRDHFVNAVLEDGPIAYMDRKDALHIYDFMMGKMSELGLKLGPVEMALQLMPHGGPQHKGMDPLAQPMSSRPSSKALEAVEKAYDDWDSSLPSTKGPGSPWTSEEEPLEGKIAGMPPSQSIPVAMMHEINAEKKKRRVEKRLEQEKAGVHWSPLTKHGFQNFIQHCHHGVPHTLGSPKAQRTQDLKNYEEIKWGPITKKGLAHFMLAFAQADEKLKPAEKDPEKMDFIELLDFSLSLADITKIPENIPAHIQATIRYVMELNTAWGVNNYDDIGWWLNEGWGPLFVFFVFLKSLKKTSFNAIEIREFSFSRFSHDL